MLCSEPTEHVAEVAGRHAHEVHVVPPDALYGAAGRLPRQASVGVGRHHSSLFDPERARHMYNDFLDELEFAAVLRNIGVSP